MPNVLQFEETVSFPAFLELINSIRGNKKLFQLGDF